MSHIPRSDLEQMFEGIRAQTKWNIDGDMLWGYFFYDTAQIVSRRRARTGNAGLSFCKAV